MQVIQEHREQINAIAATPCRKLFLTAGNDKTIRLWQVEDGKCLTIFRGHSSAVNAVAVTPDGKFFISASNNGTLKVWELEKEKCLKTISDYMGAVYAVAVSAGGRCIVAGSHDCNLRRWDLQSGECLQIFENHPACREMDGRNSLLRSSNSEFAYHDFIGHLGIGRICRQKGFGFPGHAGPVTAVAISANGRFFISGSLDNTLRLWCMRTGRCLWLFGGYRGEPNYSISAVELTSNGRYVVAASDALRIWRMSTKRFRRLFRPLGQEKPFRKIETVTPFPNDMAITSHGRFIFTIEDRGRYIRIYSFKKGALIQSIETTSTRMAKIAVTPDNRFVITGCENGEIGVWPLSMMSGKISLNI